MAITDKEQGVWSNSNQVYNKIMEGDIWSYTGADAYFIWGVGSKGRLGQNDTDSRSSPTQIPGSTWSALPHSNLGIGYMGGIKSDGTLWTWGGNDYGVLGQGDQTQYSSPTQVGTDTTWSNLSMGGDNAKSCIAVKTDGTLWTWGGNDRGNLGFNQASTPSSRSSPKQVGEDTDWHHGSAGADFMFAVKTNGTLWSWGYGKWYGQLAQGSQSSFSSPRQVGTDTTWNSISDRRQSLPGAGANFLATKTDGTLWAWGGQGDFGSLGLNQGPGGPGAGSRSSPTQVGTDTNWSLTEDPYVDSFGASAMKTDGTFWVWGGNDDGRLGFNTPSNTRYSSPTQLPGTWSQGIVTYGGSIAVKQG